AARGVGRQAHVELLLPNSPEWIAVAFGVWRTGGVLVPLSTLARPRGLAYALRHADVTMLSGVRGFLRHDYVAAMETIAPGISGARTPLSDPTLPFLRALPWL